MKLKTNMAAMTTTTVVRAPESPSLTNKNNLDRQPLTMMDMLNGAAGLNWGYFFNSELDASALRASLSRTLASFPELAGRVVRDKDVLSGVSIDLCNHGVPFVVQRMHKTEFDAMMRGDNDVDDNNVTPIGLIDSKHGNYVRLPTAKLFGLIRHSAPTIDTMLKHPRDGSGYSRDSAPMNVTLTHVVDDSNDNAISMSVLGICMNHGFADAASFFTFVNAWARCTQMGGEDMPTSPCGAQTLRRRITFVPNADRLLMEEVCARVARRTTGQDILGAHGAKPWSAPSSTAAAAAATTATTTPSPASESLSAAVDDSEHHQQQQQQSRTFTREELVALAAQRECDSGAVQHDDRSLVPLGIYKLSKYTRLAVTGLGSTQCVLRFNRELLASLKASANARSTNDALCAHLWRVVARLRPECRGLNMRLTLVVNVRGDRLDNFVPNQYFGNATTACVIEMPHSELVATGGLANVAAAIRRAVDSIDATHVEREELWIGFKNKVRYGLGRIRPNFKLLSRGLFISSFANFDVYGARFGDDKPAFFVPGVAALTMPYLYNIAPAPDGDGLDIFVRLPKAKMQSLLATGGAEAREW
ncbi:shikimate O-hydroxycinnamoyltransferase [Pycnococcus provasolii]